VNKYRIVRCLGCGKKNCYFPDTVKLKGCTSCGSMDEKIISEDNGEFDRALKAWMNEPVEKWLESVGQEKP